MNRWRLFSGVVVLGFAAGVHAEGPFFTFEGFNGFWGSGGVPDDAFKSLQKVQKAGKAELKCFAFAMNGDWVYLCGGTGYFTNNVNLPACKKLHELQKDGKDFHCVAFAPTGGWTIFSGGNGSWTEGAVPEAAFKKIAEVGKQGADLRSIAYGPKGAWVLTYNKSDVAFGDVPKKLADVLHNAAKKHHTVQCVSFTGNDWICLTNNGWWTSNSNLPSTKAISKAIEDGHSPKWVAVLPSFGEHNFEKWSAFIHRTLDGKISGGYAFLVLDHGKVVASGVEGWARAPWEKENASLKWTLDTPTQLASVSKTITAVAMLKLWEDSQKADHRFSLDDPFWPHMRKVCPTAHKSVKQVTIRQLLTHQSGFIETGPYKMPQDLSKIIEPAAGPQAGHVRQLSELQLLLDPSSDRADRQCSMHALCERARSPSNGNHENGHALQIQRTGLRLRQGRQAGAGGARLHVGSGCSRLGPFPGGWNASASDLGRFLEGIRTHKAMSKVTTEIMLKENMGWDGSAPGWAKGGLVVNGKGQQFGSRIDLFPDGIVAVFVVNCAAPSDEDLNATAWLRARGK